MVRDDSYEIDGLGEDDYEIDGVGLLPAVYRYGPGPQPARSHGNWYSYPNMLGATPQAKLKAAKAAKVAKAAKIARAAKAARFAKAARAAKMAKAAKFRKATITKKATKPVAAKPATQKTVTARVSAKAVPAQKGYASGNLASKVFLVGIGATVAYLAYKALRA